MTFVEVLIKPFIILHNTEPIVYDVLFLLKVLLIFSSLNEYFFEQV